MKLKVQRFSGLNYRASFDVVKTPTANLSLVSLLKLAFNIYYIIIKFGYNARCHWLKERAP